ncbi:MAG: carbohydrate ABC transporter permease [Ruminococcaceae bacterium]|nr:carbohydrate ABC transporter permease [Oscillospiraceae bacterium]
MLKKKRISVGNIILTAIMVLWGIVIVYPFYNSILVSFMSQAEYMRKPFAFIVSNPTLTAYEEIFSDSKFLLGYRSTLFILVTKLPLSLIITCAMGYALSRKRFPFSKAINNLTVFTMYFGGGTIPLYLLIKQYGLLDSYASLILLGSFGVYNMILVKNFFYTLPDSLEESAKIDGANDILIFARIYIPLAKPIIATVALFIAVAIWNEWFSAMLYISDPKKWPLQLVLREIIGNATDVVKEGMSEEEMMKKETFALNVQMASVVVTMLPVMLVYPFLQKYFMQGLTVGAVKG